MTKKSLNGRSESSSPKKLRPSAYFDWLIELLFLAGVFLIPTIFDRRLGIVFSGTKVAWMRAWGLTLLTIWSFKHLIFGRQRFIRTALDWPIASFLLLTTVATVTSVHVYVSFAGFYGRYEGLTTWFLFGVCYFITTNFMRGWERLNRIVITVCTASTVMAIYSIIQRFELDPYQWGGVVTWQRVIGTIGQPNFMAAYMLMAFFLSLGMLLKDKPRLSQSIDWTSQWQTLLTFVFIPVLFMLMIYSTEADQVLQWYLLFFTCGAAAVFFSFQYVKLEPIFLDLILGLNLVLNYVAILYTQSRGGYMGFFTGAVLFGLVSGRRVLLANWKKLLILGAAMLIVTGATVINPAYSPIERFSSALEVKGEDAAAVGGEEKIESLAGARGETWKSAFQVSADYPLFGIGPEVLKMVFPRYETDLFRFKEAFHVKQDRCHNETMDVPVTKGIPALLVFLLILWLFFQIGWRRAATASSTEKLFYAGALAAVLAYLIQNQFSFGVVAIVSLCWIIWGMVMKDDEGCKRDDEGSKKDDGGWPELPWLALAGITIVVAGLIWLSFLSFRSDVAFKSGKSLLEAGRLDLAAADLERSLEIYPFESGTVSHLGITYLNMFGGRQEKLDLFKRAEEVLTYGTRIDQYNADNFFLLAKINLMKRNLVEARRMSEIAVKVDPYYAEVFILLGVISETEQKIDEARTEYEQAFMINPNLSEPIDRLQALNNRLGQSGKTQVFLEKALQKYRDNALVLDRMANYYLDQGRGEKALAAAETLVKYGVDPSAGYLLRAKVLHRLGRNQQAFSDIQQVLMTAPNNPAARELFEKLKAGAQ